MDEWMLLGTNNFIYSTLSYILPLIIRLIQLLCDFLSLPLTRSLGEKGLILTTGLLSLASPSN